MRKSFLFVIILIGICLNVTAQEVEIFPQLGQRSVSSVAISPNGKQILSGSHEGTIKLLDIATGREIRTFIHSYVMSVAFNHNGRYIISGGGGDVIKLWDTTTGREIRTFFDHSSYSNGVCSTIFNSDGMQILSGHYDGIIKLWDTATGREIRTFTGHSNGVSSVAFSPDGRQIISGSRDNTIKLWDTATGREIRTFSGHSDEVQSVAFNPDGRQIVSGSYDKTIKLWDTATGQEIRTFTGHSNGVSSVAFSPDGRQIISGSVDTTIKLWDIMTGREIRTFYGHSGVVFSTAYNLDGKQIVSGGNEIILWDIATGREIRTFHGNTSWVTSVAYSPDGRQGLYASTNTIKLWDITTGREIRTFFNHQHIYSIAISPDGRQMVSSGHEIIKLWDIATGREIRTFHDHSGSVLSATFNPSGRQIVTGSYNSSNFNQINTIKLWDTATGREISTFSGGAVLSVVFSPDGRHILSCGITSDTSIKLWDIATGSEIRNFDSQQQSDSAYFSPDGRNIISGSGDGRTIKLWDTATGREIRTFYGHSDYLTRLAFNPDGRQIISGYRDGTIILWDIITGQAIRTFIGHTSVVTSLAFNPDGKQILSGSEDGTVRLWDTSTGREIAKFISFIDGEWIVLTSDGYYNASPNGDKYLNVRVGNNVYGIDQYRSIFYNPQIVEARLQGRPDPIPNLSPIQRAGEPPLVVIHSPINGARLTSNSVELSVVIESNQPIRNIQFLVNGRLVSGDAVRGIRGIRGVELEGTGITITESQNKLEFSLNLQLDPGNNRIEVIANNPLEGRASIEVFSQQAVANTLPNLWILSIGVNRYDSPLLNNLNYAVNDAREIINLFKAQEGMVYGKVNSMLIADGTEYTPTKVKIQDGFDFLKSAGANDVLLLFIAGHGMNDQHGTFYFLPSDASFTNDGAIRSAYAISQSEIQAVLNVPGRKIVFIDACHSAGAGSGITQQVDNDRLSRSLQSEGTLIFTSSKGTQFSHEMDSFRHGVFTYAILQGLRGEANLTNNNVTIFSLIEYVTARVKELTNNAQEPTIGRIEGLSSFPLARVR